jgi:hypothetical protein
VLADFVGEHGEIEMWPGGRRVHGTGVDVGGAEGTEVSGW